MQPTSSIRAALAVPVACAIATASLHAQVEWRFLPGASSDGVAAAFDSARDRLVLAGGRWNFRTSLWDGANWTADTGPQPPTRMWTAMRFDPSRQRIVMFGGQHFTPGVAVGVDLADTWEWDGSAWLQPATPVSPSARHGHAMVYSPSLQRIVLFGGERGTPSSASYNDLWSFDGSQWQPLSSSTPAPQARSFHGLAFDVARSEVVLFGGWNASGTLLGDTWTYAAGAWQQRNTPVAPSPRRAHVFEYDVARARTVLFASFPAFAGINDTWEWDGTSWTLVTPPVAPPPRGFAAMQYDPLRARMLMCRGMDQRSNLGDLWQYSNGTWLLLEDRTPAPDQRRVVTYDPVRQRTVMVSPIDSSDTVLDRICEWDGATWTKQTVPTSLPYRLFTAIAYDRARQRVVLFGGVGALSAAMGDTWEYDGTTWTFVNQTTPVQAHAMYFDSVRGHVMRHGGFDRATSAELAGLWEWNGATWTAVPTSPGPAPRQRHKIAFDAARGVAVLYGGSAGTTVSATRGNSQGPPGSSACRCTARRPAMSSASSSMRGAAAR